MYIGAVGRDNWSAYSDYTAVLQKSAHIAVPEEPKVNMEPQEPEIVTDTVSPSRQDFRVLEPVDLQAASDSLNIIQDFDFIGRDSKLEDLDVGKAISDMRKDSILQDYQYFVTTAV